MFNLETPTSFMLIVKTEILKPLFDQNSKFSQRYRVVY